MLFKKYGKTFLDQEITAETQSHLSSLTSAPLSSVATSFSPTQREELYVEKEEMTKKARCRDR